MSYSIFLKLTFLLGVARVGLTLPTASCPPGHFLACLDPGAPGCDSPVCVLCPEDTFTDVAGAFSECLPCRKPCTLSVEMETSPCTRTSDRECGCQPGYYSSHQGALNLTCIRVTDDWCGQGHMLVRPGLEDGSPIECEPCPTGFTALGNSSECLPIPGLEDGAVLSKEVVLVIFIGALFVIGVAITVLMYCLCKEKTKTQNKSNRNLRKFGRDNEKLVRHSTSSADELRRMALNGQVRKISKQYNKSDLAKNNLQAVFAPVGVPKGRRRSSAASTHLNSVQSCPDPSLKRADNNARGSFETSNSAPALPKCVQSTELAKDNQSTGASCNTVKTATTSAPSTSSLLEFSAPTGQETSQPLLSKSRK